MSSSAYISQFLCVLIEHWIVLSLSFFALRALKRRYLSPLSDFPSLNFLSTISRLGKAREVLSGKTHLTQLEAHRKYGRQRYYQTQSFIQNRLSHNCMLPGSIIRIGPNEVSISDPAMIPIIYDIQQKFTKVCITPSLIPE